LADGYGSVPDGRLLLPPDGRASVRMGKQPIIASARKTEREGAGARPDMIVLLEAHDSPDVFAERIDADAAAQRMAAGIGAEIRKGLAHRDMRDGRLAGRGWLSAKRAPGVATRLLREATRWKPCYVVRHPENCSRESLTDAIARILPETVVVRREQDALPSHKRSRRSTPPERTPEQSRG
jgi:hypothetical protein